MRQKRRILCVDSNELRASVRRFLLTTRGYAVIPATTAEAAITAFTTEWVDVVVIELELDEMDGNALAAQLRGICGEVPIILTSDTVEPGERTLDATVFLGRGHAPAALMERVRVFEMRKRGPKKAPRSVPVPAPVPALEAKHA